MNIAFIILPIGLIQDIRWSYLLALFANRLALPGLLDGSWNHDKKRDSYEKQLGAIFPAVADERKNTGWRFY